MASSVVTHTASETVQLGKQLAAELQASDIVALYGNLGSGKTQFAKGICLGLGVQSNVVSPTFTILNEYAEGKYPVYHFDFYRLRSLAELAEIGFEEYLFGDGICLVEWADLVESKLRKDRYDVKLELGAGENERIVSISKRDAQ
ncbi:MAG TPA: tRNA (adenosine(37)-N6)-threonylcarbamoyltransferase complex ATPase subunit type 1 TsaE [Bacteroidota bacterium]|nr:tRNA (adenosine(37)-N6)-threonylcarbamoyltransferase complex ATPase subunit type 1 TsaE [Bacteroidota bacterium]